MKFLTGFLAFLALAILSHYILPWWGFVAMAMIAGFLVPMHGGLSFLCGFATMAVLWGIHTWWIDSANGGDLSAKMANLLQLGSVGALWWATIFIGALLGGMGMLTGNWGNAMLTGGGGGKQRYRNKYK